MLVYPTGIPTGGGYTVENAIWIYSTADYLQKTFTSGSDNNKRYIYAFWTKGGLTGRIGYAQASDYDRIEVKGGTYADTVWKFAWEQAGSVYDTIFPQVYADDTAWRQHVMSIDTTASTGNRIRMWTNGVENTGETYANGGETPLNHTLAQFDNTSAVKLLEASAGDSVYFAQFVGIDGLSIQNGDNAITDFGEFDDNGVWIPINVSGLTFGTNGFLLDFAVAPGTGNGAGTDVSGRGNHFTDTSMTTAQQVTDTPTDDADNNIGNYATFNPLDRHGSTTLANGNLHANGTTTHEAQIRTTIALTGKKYWEIEADTLNANAAFIGILKTNTDITTSNSVSLGTSADGYSINCSTGSNNGKLYNNATSGTDLGTITNGDIICVAFDADTLKLFFGLNGSWLGSADPANGTNPAFTVSAGTYTAAVSVYTTSSLFKANFGQTTLAYTVPTGFDAGINTANLPAPTVTDPSKYFFAKTYTGDTNNNRNITGFQDGAGDNVTPDLVWIKGRSNATSHYLQDVARAFGGSKELVTDSTNAEGSQGTGNGYIGGVVAGGFTAVDGGTNDAYVNENSRTYVAWMWKAGGAASATSPAGTLASNSSVADHGGFSIGTFTVNTTGAFTVGHGLSRVPAMIIVKDMDAAGGWWVWIEEYAATGTYLRLETTDATSTSGTFLSATPTDEVFATSGSWLTNGEEHVFYAFAKTPGMIASGTYTGNGVADGPMVTVDDGASGFKPAWIMIKQISSAGNDWEMYDGVRDAYNPVDLRLKASAADAEASAANFDFTANGFKIRSTAGGVNTDTSTFIYLAFAEDPFGGDTVAQAKAR